MEDRYAIRERKPGESLTVIPPPPVVPWDAVPREPHLLDYIIILRKHQWLILTFLVHRGDGRNDRDVQDEAGVRGGGERRSGQRSAA